MNQNLIKIANELNKISFEIASKSNKPTYKDYVEKKRDKGEKPLPKEDWTNRVFPGREENDEESFNFFEEEGDKKNPKTPEQKKEQEKKDHQAFQKALIEMKNRKSNPKFNMKSIRSWAKDYERTTLKGMSEEYIKKFWERIDQDEKDEDKKEKSDEANMKRKEIKK